MKKLKSVKTGHQDSFDFVFILLLLIIYIVFDITLGVLFKKKGKEKKKVIG